MRSDDPQVKVEAIAFDLLTALLDSWTLWNRAAGNDVDGRRWRNEYLRMTYAAGDYRAFPHLDTPATPERILFAVEDVRARAGGRA